jgi:hypothetical protein
MTRTWLRRIQRLDSILQTRGVVSEALPRKRGAMDRSDLRNHSAPSPRWPYRDIQGREKTADEDTCRNSFGKKL